LIVNGDVFVTVADPAEATLDGAAVSRLMKIEFAAWFPALSSAEHVIVIPAVSVLTVVEPHPLSDPTFAPDVASVTDQVTPTSLVYQLLLPSVPVTVGVIDGEVVSSFRCVWLFANWAVFAPGEPSTAWHSTRWSPAVDVETSPERVVALLPVFVSVTALPSTRHERLATPETSVAVTWTVAGAVLNHPFAPFGVWLKLIVGAVVSPFAIVSVPEPVEKSLETAAFSALTLNGVDPAAAAAVVEIVRVELLDVSAAPKLSELGLNEALAPDGRPLAVRLTLKAVPVAPFRATVTEYVALPAIPDVSVPVCEPTVTVPTRFATTSVAGFPVPATGPGPWHPAPLFVPLTEMVNVPTGVPLVVAMERDVVDVPPVVVIGLVPNVAVAPEGIPAAAKVTVQGLVLPPALRVTV
jgi:hypothetical protein